MQRYCKACTGWHDLDEPWPHNCTSHWDKSAAGPQIVRDIDPYVSSAANKHSGKRELVGGRRQHREFLKRNDYVEVGNDSSLFKPPQPQKLDLVTKREIVQAIKQIQGE